MRSFTTKKFWATYFALPKPIRLQAVLAYQRFKQNPNHPGLQFKPIQGQKEVYSVRITRDYRALGVKTQDEILWFWIGSHADYDKMLK